MKNSTLPRNPTSRLRNTPPSAAKRRPPRNHKSSDDKENHAPPPPPPQHHFKSPLPPRPPPSTPHPNPLKRKSPENSLPAAATTTTSSDSGVKVIVRVKPLCGGDNDEGGSIVHSISSDSLSFNRHNFKFDSVAHADTTQLDIFELVGVPLVENCLAGFNSSVFAYGKVYFHSPVSHYVALATSCT